MAAIANGLIAAGRPPQEPCAVVERGTLPDQRTIAGTLATIADAARRASVSAPAITVVGAVAELSGTLAWRSPGQLAGRTVAVTRARAQASELARQLQELGAAVVEAPTIRIERLPFPPLDFEPYDLLCLTSANAVEALFEGLASGAGGPRDARALAGTRVAAIGAATAQALAAHGILADVIPERAVAESLVEALAGVSVRRALVARAKEAREVLEQALRERGAEVDVAILYETVPEALSRESLERTLGADYITFTSSSTVRNLLATAGGELLATAGEELPAGPRIVSIGPVTSATLREAGLRVDLEAARHDVDGLLAAILADAERPAG